MASERVLDVVVRRHVFDAGRPFSGVRDGIFGGISQPDIARLFSRLVASSPYREFSSLVEQAQGSAGLMRFLQLDLNGALLIDPKAEEWAGRVGDEMAVTFFPAAATQPANARDSSFVRSASTRTASRTLQISVDAVGDQIRRPSLGGRSSNTGFDGPIYAEYFNAAS